MKQNEYKAQLFLISNLKFGILVPWTLKLANCLAKLSHKNVEFLVEWVMLSKCELKHVCPEYYHSQSDLFFQKKYGLEM